MPPREPTEEERANIAQFFNNIATDVKESGGIYMGDILSPWEAPTVFRELKALVKKYRGGE
jgi:hypothetical protein